MSIVSETVRAISERTGLEPEGRNFKAQINEDNQVRFEVTAKHVIVWGTLKGDKERQMQIVSHERCVSYIHGFLFSYGFTNKRGEHITSTSQLKGGTTMKTQTVKSEKKTSAIVHGTKVKSKAPVAEKKTPAVEKVTGKGYGLGKPIDKSIRNEFLKEVKKDQPKLGTVLKLMIQKHWDNESCIHGAKFVGYDDVEPAEVNKVRRQLHRKGVKF